ncbi:deaminated glutathione amidase [Roseitranquillus sediminis]|uniref:deaminated glutathione amidase n=1 Tax=Roseitranquillus sediminis TaxID=2809051 RepID=UPI001D0CDCC3|nr:deaminated glutathione amidase [Roseitranquillus sediminis]MBM9594935.1 deaminated glutathione amidase [Roseitranquillus sediminis]
MRVALGQFAAANNWQDNLEIVLDLVRRASAAGCDLLVLPEGILARDIADPEIVRKAAQPLNGPFMSALLEGSAALDLAIAFCLHVPSEGSGRVFNTHVVLRKGQIVASYRKLHLYDAFAAQESEHVAPGDLVPDLIEIAGLKVGLMTCYDVRFPELARYHAIQGADVLILPAAWVRGPGKEHHWETLVTARALENTCYVVAVGECGPRNIGASMVVDPLGVVTHRAGSQPTLILAELDPEGIARARADLPVLKNRRFGLAMLEAALHDAKGD